MKLYANTLSERASMAKKGGNEWIQTSLYLGNKYLGVMTLKLTDEHHVQLVWQDGLTGHQIVIDNWTR